MDTVVDATALIAQQEPPPALSNHVVPLQSARWSGEFACDGRRVFVTLKGEQTSRGRLMWALTQLHRSAGPAPPAELQKINVLLQPAYQLGAVTLRCRDSGTDELDIHYWDGRAASHGFTVTFVGTKVDSIQQIEPRPPVP